MGRSLSTHLYQLHYSSLISLRDHIWSTYNPVWEELQRFLLSGAFTVILNGQFLGGHKVLIFNQIYYYD